MTMKAVILLCAFVTIAKAGVEVAPAAEALLEAGTSVQHRSEDNAGNYQFEYEENHTSGGSFRKETGDAHGNKVGSYGLHDADGRVRVVKYVADALGFRASIHSNEPGVEPKDPAAASINKPAVAVASAPMSVPTAVVAPAPTVVSASVPLAPPVLAAAAPVVPPTAVVATSPVAHTVAAVPAVSHHTLPPVHPPASHTFVSSPSLAAVPSPVAPAPAAVAHTVVSAPGPATHTVVSQLAALPHVVVSPAAAVAHSYVATGAPVSHTLISGPSFYGASTHASHVVAAAHAPASHTAVSAPASVPHTYIPSHAPVAQRYLGGPSLHVQTVQPARAINPASSAAYRLVAAPASVPHSSVSTSYHTYVGPTGQYGQFVAPAYAVSNAAVGQISHPTDPAVLSQYVASAPVVQIAGPAYRYASPVPVANVGAQPHFVAQASVAHVTGASPVAIAATVPAAPAVPTITYSAVPPQVPVSKEVVSSSPLVVQNYPVVAAPSAAFVQTSPVDSAPSAAIVQAAPAVVPVKDVSPAVPYAQGLIRPISYAPPPPFTPYGTSASITETHPNGYSYSRIEPDAVTRHEEFSYSVPIYGYAYSPVTYAGKVVYPLKK